MADLLTGKPSIPFNLISWPQGRLELKGLLLKGNPFGDCQLGPGWEEFVEHARKALEVQKLPMQGSAEPAFSGVCTGGPDEVEITRIPRRSRSS